MHRDLFEKKTLGGGRLSFLQRLKLIYINSRNSHFRAFARFFAEVIPIGRFPASIAAIFD